MIELAFLRSFPDLRTAVFWPEIEVWCVPSCLKSAIYRKRRSKDPVRSTR